MSAETECSVCGATVSETAKFCPQCGSPLGGDSTATTVLPPPEHESEPAPVEVARVEPTYFGVTPATALLAVGAAALGVGIALIALGSVAVGLLVLAGGLLALAGFVGAASRRPDTGVARRSAKAFDSVRDRAAMLGTSFAARSGARRQANVLLRELDQLSRDRDARLAALGRAVYAGDDAATESLRGELEQLDGRIDETRTEVERIMSEAQERIGRARMETSRTQIVATEPFPTPGEADVPEPARVPEPFPPPGEADPPEPARIPEPMPPPDEGDIPEAPPPPQRED